MVHKKIDSPKKKGLLCGLHTPCWLFFILLATLILRIPSFFEPYSYGDEMIYLTLGEAVKRGIPLYSQIHDNKPPLLYLMAALAGNLFWFKAILAIWQMFTIFFFWKLTQTLFEKKKKAQVVAVTVFAILTTIPLLEGNIVNAELFALAPTILAFTILLTQKLKFPSIFLSGMLFSLAALFKIPAAFDILAIVFLWLAKERRINFAKIKKVFIKTLYLTLGFITPIALTFVWYYLQGALRQYLVAAFLQNVGYLSSWRPGDIQKSLLQRNAPLLIRTAIVAISMLFLFLKRKKLTPQFMLLSAWLIFSLFATTLSERPYPHYLIQSVPAVSGLIAILFTYETLEQSLVILPLTLAVFVPVYFNFWHYPTFSYYNRFIKFASGKMTKDSYLSSFDSDVPTHYEIANYITSSTKKDEKVFVWGPDSSVVYALSRRFPPGKYIASYHIKDFSTPDETIKTLKKDMPSYIVILPNSDSFPELKNLLAKNYGLVKSVSDAKIWKLLGSRVRALLF